MTGKKINGQYAEIYPDTKVLEFDRHFDYKIPAGLQGFIKTGNLARIPLKNRIETGYVSRIKNYSNVSEINLKYIDDAATGISLFNPARLKLIYWMCSYYIQPFGKIAGLFAPPADKDKTFEVLKNPEKFLKYCTYLSINRELLPVFDKIPASVKYLNQKKIVEYILRCGSIEKKRLLQQEGFSGSSLSTLIKKGFVLEKKIRETAGMAPLPDGPGEKVAGKPMKHIIEQVISSIGRNQFRGYLLKDFSYREKLDIIFNLCNFSIDNLKKILIISPESSGAERIAFFLGGKFQKKCCIYTSDKNPAERFEQWYDIAKDRYSIIAGTRSAVFLPFYDPDVIILEQEHDSSYKDSSIIRYNTQDVVLKLAKILKIPVLFFSNAPSIKNMYLFNGANNHCIISRGEIFSKANVVKSVVDLKKVDQYTDDSTITKELFQAIKESSGKGFNSLIFAGRRGMSSYITCKNCGYVPKCPSCNVSYTFHSSKKMLMCHHCKKSEEFTGLCSRCRSKNIRYKNNGIESIEAKLKKRFPQMPVIRVDSDTKGRSLQQCGTYGKVSGQSPLILLGTSKILNYPNPGNIGLAAIVDFDSLMQMPDFHTNERAFQVLDKIESFLMEGVKCRFIIQALNTDNAVLNNFINDDYNQFYSMELAGRKELNYPPYSNIVNIILSGKEEKNVIKNAEMIFFEIEKLKNPDKIILGPSPCPYSRINMNYRWHILIKTNDIMRFNIKLAGIIRNINKSTGIKIIADVDPVWIL